MNIDMDLVSGLDQYHLYNYFVSELKVQSGRQDAELLSISKLN
jgi:hypothetical protein